MDGAYSIGVQRRKAKMGAVTAILAFLTVGTGFWVYFDNSWSWLLKIILVVHPVVSIVGTLWIVVFTVRKALNQQMDRPWRRLAAVPGTAIALILLATFGKDALIRSQVWLWFASLVAFGSVVVGLRFPVDRVRAARERYYELTGGLTWALWLGISTTGLVALVFFQTRTIAGAITVHRVLAYGLVVLFVAHLFALRMALGKEVGSVATVGRPARYGLALTLLGVAALAAVYGLKRDASWVIPLSSTPLEKRPVSERTWKPSQPVAASDLNRMELTAGCGTGGGCHAEILEDHRRSLHNITYRPGYFKKNLEDMAAEIGEGNKIICAGCHRPVALFDPRKSKDFYLARDAVSCVVCHTVSGAGVVDRRRSWLEFSPPWDHMRMFPEGDGPPGAADRLFIRLNAAGHGRAFARPLHAQDALCNACHHLQMPPLATNGLLENPPCIRCHMQPQTLFGSKGPGRSHLFMGASVGPALLAGDTKTADLVRRWAEGTIVPELGGWETLWAVRDRDDSPIPSVPWLMVSMYFDVPPRPGEVFTLHLLTTNTGLGHNFPSGSLDLVKAWLDFTVQDEGGRVLCAQGRAAPGDPIPTDTPILGGHMLGQDNHIVVRNRVWQVKQKFYDRLIPNKLDIRDDLQCRIPADAKGPVQVRARWRYRKLDQAYLDYALGPLAIPAPDIVAGEAAATISLARPGKVYAPGAGY